MARPKGIKQPHPLGSVATRAGVQPRTVLDGSVTTSTGVKISELIAASAANSTDQIEVNQAGTSRSITVDQLGVATGSGTVTSTSVTSANGFAGTVATATTTPAITLSTTVTGLTKGNGTALSAAVAGTDYMTPANVSAAYLALAGGTLVGALTGTTATFSGLVTAPGAQLQMVSTQTGAVATGTTVIPQDDTIPQITEGTEFMTLAITPRSATSKLIIEVTIMLATTATGAQGLMAALFQDSTANALAAISTTSPVATSDISITFRHVMTSGTTSSTTFRVRAGCGSAGTTTFNGSGAAGGTRRFGGVMASGIVIREVAV